MKIRELTKSGAFVAVVFALVLALLPFGVEQIGETTGLYSFPVTKRLRRLFAGETRPVRGAAAKAAVNWERYREDLEDFTRWAECRPATVVSLVPYEEPVAEVVEERKITKRLWPVSVVSCTADDPVALRSGYAFISGFGRCFEAGEIIAPSEELCGYEIVFIGERSVWLRAIFDSAGDAPMGVVKFPEFTRTDGDSIVRGNRRYVAGDAFELASGGYLAIDSFLVPAGVIFKILDENRREVATIVAIVIGEKGGR